jgi:hypothetical protein
MMSTNLARSAVAASLLIIAGGAQNAPAQANSSAGNEARVTTTPGPEYEAGSFKRKLLGGGWRDVWTTPLTVPVLNLETHEGGLELERRGGGFHSFVLHLKEDDGWKEYRFRSVNKFPSQGMSPEIKGTLAGDIWQDQTSILFPGAPLLVPPLHRAIGAIHTTPTLYVMGDSPRLEAQRDTFVGMLGMFELKAQEAPDDKPGYAGSTKIKGTENFLEDINESREHRLDEHEFLAVRLVDFLINDVDRSMDNFDWARFGEKGAYTWRPVPLDRDQAFVDARGLLNTLVVTRLFPKQIPFEPTFNLKGLTYTSYTLDRRLLQRLTTSDFRDVAHRVRHAITDDVIEQVVARIPAPWRARTDADERIRTALLARRNALPDVAMDFYRQLAGEVDVHGTAEADRIDVMRHADGRVTVTISDPERAPVIVRRPDGAIVTTSAGTIADRDAYYARTFLPSETKEVRIYMAGGSDVGIVRGAPSDGIAVRIIGGEGDDVLADSAGGARTSLYDAEGTNRITLASGTHVDTRAWKPLRQEEGFRAGSEWAPDWGGRRGWAPSFDYTSSAGVIVGIGPRFRDYGFRRLPYHWDAGLSLQVGTGNGRLGLIGDLDHRAENRPRGFRVSAMATQLEDTRFFGYGNDTPEVGRDLSLIDQKLLMLEPSLVHYIGWRAREGEGNAFKGRDTLKYSGLRPLIGELRVGGALGWIDPEPSAASPLSTTGVIGSTAFGFAGAQVALELDRTDDDAVPTSGWTLDAEAGAYPGLLDLDRAFGTASAGSAFYIPLGESGGPHVALRAGGSLALGGYPAQFAAAVGGRRSLRGYSFHRFAGDAAAYSGAELRVPVGTVNFIVRSQLGLFALADAGRVWFDGSSSGGWHTGVGGGFWLNALGRSVSVAYAHGEGGRFYLSSGLFY